MDDSNNGVTVLPDGSAFAIGSLPLPATHWIYERDKDGFAHPPRMALRMPPGRARDLLREMIWDAAKHAVRGATMHGKEKDFDPDVLCQNMVVGLIGYFSEDGLGFESWMNPPLEQLQADAELRKEVGRALAGER